MNPTQLTGVTAFALATVACAWRRRYGPALVFASATLEIWFGWRFKIHNAVEPVILHAAAPYADKHHVQYVLLGMAAALTIGLARWLRRGSLSGYAALGAVALIAIEMISLHAIDAICWWLIGPVMLIGWLWAATALIAIVAAISGGHDRPSAGRERRPA